jgi:hypothetical protein
LVEFIPRISTLSNSMIHISAPPQRALEFVRERESDLSASNSLWGQSQSDSRRWAESGHGAKPNLWQSPVST